MDMNLSNTLLAGDPRLVDHIVGQVKSQGIFDQFRKECIADVDTKPAYQNLQNRVEGSVNSFLKSQTWKPDLNKNQLRETLRKHIHDASFLEVGVERIVDQVVNPKIYSVFMPQIEDVVYKFLGLERPKPREKNGSCNLKDLLPKDLDPVSPESDRNSLKDESLESMDMNDEHLNNREENPSESKSRFENKDIKQVEDTKKVDETTKCEINIKVEDVKNNEETKKIEETNNQEEIKNGQVDLDENSMDEFEKPLTKTASTSNLNISFKSDDKTEEEEESPQFEPIDIMNLNESNLSNDSHLSGISELTSHRSRSPDYSNDFSRDNFDHDQDSQLSKVSSNSRLSIVTDFGSSNQASTQFPNSNEDSKDKYSKDNFRAIRDVEEGKYKESKFNFESVKNKSNSQEKDLKSLKSFSSKENSRDENDSCLKEKNESRDGKDKSESSKSKISKNKSESRDSRRHRDRKKLGSSSSSRHSKSSTNERDQSREGSEKMKMKEEKPKEKEEKKIQDEKKEKLDKKEKDEKKDPGKQEIVQDIFKDLKDIYKEKIRELREKKELTEKEKLNKDSKTRDSKEKKDSSRDKNDHKTSKSSDRHEKSSRKSNESKDKERKRDDHRHSKDSKSRSSRSEKEPRAKKEGKSERSETSESKKDTKNESQSKEKKQREEKKKSKDDHSSLRKNSNDRRSTDRDGSNGSSSKSSQKNTSSTGKSTTTLTKETNNTNNSSGDTSDGIEDSQGNDYKLATAEFESQKVGINCTSEDFQNFKTDHLNSNASNEVALPLKKRPFSEDSPSLSPVEPKLKKPKFAKNFHEAKKLMKIRRRMEKQNSEEGLQSEVRKLKIEETGNESLSNSPLSAKDITKVPDEERVQIIEVPDEECEEPYSEEIAGMTLEETSMIILEGEVLGHSQQKESKLSLMERSIRQSLDEMISDQKLAENAERNIKKDAPSNLKTDAFQIENSCSEKDIENVKEAFISLDNDQKDENFSAKKSLGDKLEENLEKLDKADWKFKNIRGKGETDEFKKQQNEGIKVESEEKYDSQNESGYKTLLPNMELKEWSQEISKESNISEDKETFFEDNLKVVEEFLPKNNKQVGNKEQEDQLKECSALSQVEEDCLYLEPDNERAWRFATFLEALEKKLNLNQEMESFGENSQERSEPKSMAPPQLKRKLSSSPLSDILLQNANNNNDGIKERETEALDEGDHGGKRRKLGRPKKQRPSLGSYNPPGILNGENFVMPLSPESDVSASSEKTPGQALKEEKSRHRSNQRYSSDDLYKPRPLFSSSSRRNRRSNQDQA